MEPEWYLQICRELINLSPVLLTGLAMVLVSSRVAYDKDPHPVLPPWRREHRRLRWLALTRQLNCSAVNAGSRPTNEDRDG
jgi:hypothetical protein